MCQRRAAVERHEEGRDGTLSLFIGSEGGSHVELAVDAGISGRQNGCSVPQNAIDAAAPGTTSAQLERSLRNAGIEGRAHDANGSHGEGVGKYTTAPPTPPDEPGAMTEQTLERWSLSDLIGVPRLGRLLSAMQRAAG